MDALGNVNWLTYSDAAKRVGRDSRTIKRWQRNGMVMSFNRHGERIVREDVLLAWFRQTLANSPVHQYRLRAARAERGLGVAIRAGQEAGEIATIEVAAKRREELKKGTLSSEDTVPSARAFASRAELYGGLGDNGIYAMTDNVSDERFALVLTEAQSEGNVSRSNIVRKEHRVANRYPIPERHTTRLEREQTPTPPPSTETGAQDVLGLFTRGSTEYAALQAALRRYRPACDGNDEFTADKPTSPDTLARICAACPVLEQCAAYAAASKPTGGCWPTNG